MVNHIRAGQEALTQEIVASGFKLLGERMLLQEYDFLRFEKVEAAQDRPGSRRGGE